MDINPLLQGFDCACGKHHNCAIEHVYIERGAIAHLGELCADYSRILLVADENTYAAAGKLTEQALVGKITGRVTYFREKYGFTDYRDFPRIVAPLLE